MRLHLLNWLAVARELRLLHFQTFFQLNPLKGYLTIILLFCNHMTMTYPVLKQLRYLFLLFHRNIYKPKRQKSSLILAVLFLCLIPPIRQRFFQLNLLVFPLSFPTACNNLAIWHNFFNFFY